MNFRFLFALVVMAGGTAALDAHAEGQRSYRRAPQSQDQGQDQMQDEGQDQGQAPEQPKPQRQVQRRRYRNPANRKSLHDEVSGQGYGMAGCGLGSIVFGPKPGLIQVVAGTVNGTAGSQTFGITTGTSNCDIKEAGTQAAVFIEVNKEIVKKEAARGEGETVEALAQMLECSSASELGPELRSNYEYYFAKKNDSYEIVRRLTKNGICKAG